MDKLKQSLPRGYTIILAKQNNCTRQNVTMVINGGKKSHPIYKQAIELAKQHQQAIRKFEKELTSL